MKRWQIIFIIIGVFMLAKIADGSLFVDKTVNDFNAGNFTNTYYNETGNYVALGQREIGVQMNNSFDWNNSLTGLYHFDNDTLDYSGQGNDATKSGTVVCLTTTDGQINTSCAYNTGTDATIIPSATSTSSSFSISWWFNTESGNGYHFSDGNDVTNLLMRSFSATTLAWYIGDVNAGEPTIPSHYGNWLHGTISHYSNGTAFLYINGIKTDIVTGSNYIGLTTDLYLGNRQALDRDYTGSLDEVAIWERALTENEALNIYNAQKGNYTTGNFTSQVFDAGGNATWQNISWVDSGVGEIVNTSLDTSIDYVVNTHNLLGLYHLDNDTKDYSGYGSDGTPTAGVICGTSTDGQINTSCEFDGTTDDINAGSPSQYGTNADVTVCAWANADNPTPDRETIVSKADSNTATSWYLGTATGGGSVVWLSRTGADQDVVSAGITVTAGVWEHWCGTINDTTNVMEIFHNGVSKNSISTFSGSFRQTDDLEIGDSLFWTTGSDGDWDGKIDEVAIWNRTLSDTEILNLYKRQVARFNISVRTCDDASCSGESWTNLGNVKSPQTLSLTNNTYFQYLFQFETDNASFTPKLYNVSVNYDSLAPPAVTPVINVSMLGNHIQIDDFTFSSSTFSLAHNQTFNTSDALTGLIAMGSFNAVKLTGGQPNDISVRIDVDGVTVQQEIIRSVSSTNTEGSTGVIANFTVPAGEHSMAIFFARTGNGNIEINDIDFSLGQLKTNADSPVIGNIDDINISFSSNTDIPVINFTVNKSTNANSSTFYTLKTSITSVGGNTRVFCKIHESAYFVRDVSPGSVASASIGFFEEELKGTHNDSVECRNTGSANVTITGQMLRFNLGDAKNNTIQGKYVSNTTTDASTTLTLTAGTYILANFSHTVENGTQGFLTASVSMASTTGSQQSMIDINMSNVGDNNCYTKKERDFSGSNNVGNAYIYHTCRNLTVGSTYTGTLRLIVPAGETIEVFDEMLTFFETAPFDITTINIPPIVNIITPLNGSSVTGIVPVNWTINDLDTTLTNVTISNGTFSTQIYNNSPSTNLNTTFNTINFVNLAYYNLTVESCEDNTSESFCGNDTHVIMIQYAIFNFTITDVGQEWARFSWT